MTSGASTKNPVSIAVFGSARDDFCLLGVFGSIVVNICANKPERLACLLKAGVGKFLLLNCAQY
jgi:hypothetical protein